MRPWGEERLLSNLKAWLTTISNMSVYQGWHDWHTDGPAHHGRYHKVTLTLPLPLTLTLTLALAPT